MNFKKKIIVLSLISFSLFAKCKKDLPIDTNTFISWFINPSKADLKLKKLTKKVTDSLVVSIRNNAKKGVYTETLFDTINTAYFVGIKTPAQIKSDTSYPLIIYLHGGTGTKVNTKGQKAFEMLSPLTDSLNIFLVSPSASANARWWDAIGMSRILQTLRFMTLHYPIDTQKVFLAGVSDGATGCWAAANTIYGPFAGFFAISGYGGMLPMTGMKFIPENLMQRPIYNVNAGKDRLYPLEMINRFIDYMTQNGVQVTSKIYPDQDHGFDYRDQEFASLCNYIRTWSRPCYKGINCNILPDYPNIPDNVFLWQTNSNNRLKCNAVKKDDTLFVNIEGLSSLILRHPPFNDRFWVKINNKPAKRYSEYDPHPVDFLNLIKHSCFPHFSTENLIQLKL